jgi:hypothetical protein
MWRLAFPPPPTGYYWPQHTMWGEGPGGLFVGRIVERDGCFYTDSERGTGLLVIWPMFSSVSLVDGEPLITISGRSFRPGDEVRLGGGVYESGELPDVARAALDVPCDGPWAIATGIADAPR